MFFKRPRHEATNVFMCEAFATECAGPKARRRGKLKLSDLLAETTGPTRKGQMNELQGAREKEWST